MRLLIVVTTYLASIAVAWSQTQSPAQPIELPEFIVTGKEQVGVPGASKQSPHRPPILAKTTLDSLNPVEKLPLPTLPGTPFPRYQQQLPFYPGWVDAELGNYLTPALAAGYSFETAGYLFDAVGHFETSSGWLPGSKYTLANLRLRSTYVAPEEYYIFGGSLTKVDAGLSSKNYMLYARPNAPSRSQMLLSAEVNNTGQWNSIAFSTNVQYNNTSIADSSRSSNTNQDLQATLEVNHRGSTFDLGGVALLRYSEYQGIAYHQFELGMVGATSNSTVSLSGSLKGQLANTTTKASRSGLGILGAVQWHTNPRFTIDLQATSGLRATTITQMIKANPYMADTATVDIPYDVVDVTGTLRYHPVVAITAQGSLRLRRTDRDLVWARSDVGVFIPRWLTTTTIEVYGSICWLVNTSDAVNADLTFRSSSIQNAQTPYVAPIEASAGYTRSWAPRLQSEIELLYVGQRYADVENKRTLDGYMDVRVNVTYGIESNLNVFVRAENLVGSNMVIWEGYKERGVFVSGGLSWRF